MSADVLAVLDAEIATSAALESSDALHADKLPKLREARDAVVELIAERDRLTNIVRSHEAQITRITAERAELIELVSETADEHFGPLASVIYDGPDDEVGCRVCCGVVSYAPHSTDCIAARLRAALARVQGGAK